MHHVALGVVKFSSPRLLPILVVHPGLYAGESQMCSHLGYRLVDNRVICKQAALGLDAFWHVIYEYKEQNQTQH